MLLEERTLVSLVNKVTGRELQGAVWELVMFCFLMLATQMYSVCEISRTCIVIYICAFFCMCIILQ